MHIFTVAATLVGVCLTVIGLIRVILTINSVNTIVDDILSVDALVFLVSCLFAYTAIRTSNRQRRRQWERVADLVFLLALALMTIVCALITYALV